MNIAIIGAGLSGLACTYRLNQLGVRPTIFERKSIIGEIVNLYGIHLNSFSHLAKNPLSFFEKRYHLILKPKAAIRELTMRVGDKEVNIKGRLGFIFNRGAERTSLEQQIYNQIDADIYLDTYIIDSMLDELKNRFDAVVVASGESDIPDSLGIWRESGLMMTRSAIIDGNYKKEKIIAWINMEYATNAYVYLVPISENKAKICMMVQNIAPGELDYFWKRMLAAEDITDNIIETWDCEFHDGTVRTNRLGNVYFVGNAGGMIDDFLGFGIINAIASGIFAAESIVQGINFEESIRPILNQVKQLHNLRILANRMDNRKWSRAITFLGLPGVRHVIYKTPLLQFHQLGRIVGTFIRK